MPSNIALLLVCLIAMSVLQICSTSAYPYSVSFTVKNSTTTTFPLATNAISLKTSESCSANLLQKLTTASSTYTIDTTMYSILGNNIGHGTLNNQNALSCKTLGDVTTSDTSGGKYGGRSLIQVISSVADSVLTSSYSCNTAGNNIDFVVDPYTDYDAFGNVPNRLATTIIPAEGANYVKNITDYIDPANYNTCGSLFTNSTPYVYTNYNVGNDKTALFIYPFNSTGGRINYSFSLSPSTSHMINCGTNSGFTSCTLTSGTMPEATFSVYLYDIEDETLQLLQDETTSCGFWTGVVGSTIDSTFSGQINLGINNQNKNYYLIVEEYFNYSLNSTFLLPCTRTILFTEPAFNISVYTYRANYVCSELSECNAGTRTQTCTDPAHIAPDEINYVPCFEFANQSINLGFDDYYTMDTFFCTNYILFCNPTSEKRQRLYPTGWNIPNRTVTSIISGTGYLYDMITLTDEKYFPDSDANYDLSLKMWYTPKKNYLPKFNETGTDTVNCNATTEGRLPEVWYSNVDSAFFISHNFTALSPYMGLTFRVARCDDIPQQGSSAIGCGGVNFGCNASFFGTFWGAVDFYTHDGCPAYNPPASLITQIVDLTSNTSKAISESNSDIKAYDFAQNEDYLSPDYREYRIDNMNINHTYEIRFAINPNNGLDDITPYCLYLDDVNIAFREHAANCDIHECFTDYDNNGIPDYSYVDTVAISGGCKPIITPMAPNCVPSSKAAEVIAIKAGTAGKNYTCLPGAIMAMYDPAKDDWSFVTNSSVCVAEEAAANASTGVIDALTPFAEELQASGLGFFVIFLSPIFWGFIIAVAIGAFVGYKSKIAEIGIITILGILIIEAMPQFGIFPPWFIIIFIVIAGFIAVDYLKRKFTGQNN
jgi:hypothetical protein